MTVPRSLLESLAGCDASDLVAINLGKPEMAIRSGCDPDWDAAGCWESELGDHATGADAPDFPDFVAQAQDLGKPEIAIRSGGDPDGVAIGCEDRDLGDRAAGADASDFVALVLGKPEIAIGSGSDPDWGAIGCEDRELGDPH